MAPNWFVEGPECVRLFLGKVVQPVEDALDERGANPSDDAVILERLARDVQRQVLGIDQAAEESQVLRHQLAALGLDEHPLGAEAQTVLEPCESHALEVGRRAIHDRAELDRRIGRQVEMPERRLIGMVGQVLIESRVLLLGNLALGLDPDRLLVVEDLAPFSQPDRMRHEAGEPPDDVLDPPFGREILGILLEMEDHLGATRQRCNRPA